MSTLKRTVTYDHPGSNKRFKTTTQTKKRAVSKPTKSAIRALISASRETKEVINRGVEFLLSTVSGEDIYITNFPVPQTGNGSHNRVGREISPIKLSMKYLLHNNSSQTLYVRAMVLRVRQGYALANGDLDNRLFEGTGGQDVRPAGDIKDMISTPDRQEFVVMYDRIHTLGYDAAGYSSPNPRVAIGIKDFVPLKSMHFEDNDFDQPITDRYILVMIPRRSDNDESLGEALEFTSDLTMLYKD